MFRCLRPTRNLVKRMVSTDMTGSKALAIPKYSSEQVMANVPPTYVSVLNNGLTIATENTGAPTATIGVWVASGSRFETPDVNGVAHFVEHMIFKGTSTKSQTELELEIENMGAHLNAYTSREQTAYLAKCFSGDVPKALELLADVIQNSNFGTSEIERERSVILREMEDVESNLQEVVFDHLHATAYQDCSLGQTILGPTKNIKSLTRDNMIEYITNHYKPGRMVLAAAGGVDHAQLHELAEKHFTNLCPSFEGIMPDPGEKYYTGSEIMVRDDNMPLAHVAIAVETPGWTSPDSLPLMVASTLVGSWDRTCGGGMHNASDLAKVAYKHNLAHSFNSFNTIYNDTALWGNYFVCEKLNIQVFTDCLLDEWMRITNSASDFEVERAKNILKTNMMLNLDGTTQICEDIGRQMLCYGRRIPPHELDARINAITAETVRDVCYKYIYDKCPVQVGVGPVENAVDYGILRGRMYWFRV